MGKNTLTMWTRSKITRRVTKSHLLPLVKSPASLHWRYLSVQMVWNDIKRFLMNCSCSTWRISKRRESRLSLANLMKNELAKSCAKPLDSTWQPKRDTSGFCQILILNSFKYRNKILLRNNPKFQNYTTRIPILGSHTHLVWYRQPRQSIKSHPGSDSLFNRANNSGISIYFFEGERTTITDQWDGRQSTVIFTWLTRVTHPTKVLCKKGWMSVIGDVATNSSAPDSTHQLQSMPVTSTIPSGPTPWRWTNCWRATSH